MTTLHIVPGDSASGSLRHALKEAGRDDEVLAFLDDLSCGPIASTERAARADWWAPFHERFEVEQSDRAFWERVARTDDRLVVWYGRHSARELAFFLAWSDRLQQRPFHVVDVTGRPLQYTRPDGSKHVTQPMRDVGTVPTTAMPSLFSEATPVDAREREAAARTWRALRAENAPFRVVALEGLISAPIDHFDTLILDQVTTEWRSVVSVIHEATFASGDPYVQVGDVMLLTRVAALVEAGELQADGNPFERFRCSVRLPHPDAP